MNNKIKLKVPKLEELSYRQKLLSQTDTMAHHKYQNLESKFYHRDTGCIDFPQENWELWYKEYTDNESKLYYAYVSIGNDTYIGEVSFYKSSDGNCYDMNVIIEAKYRHQGYGHESLTQLLEHAFNRYGINKVQLELDNKNIAARKLCANAGFNVISKSGTKIEIYMYKQDFIENKNQKRMYS